MNRTKFLMLGLFLAVMAVGCQSNPPSSSPTDSNSTAPATDSGSSTSSPLPGAGRSDNKTPAQQPSHWAPGERKPSILFTRTWHAGSEFTC